MRVLLFCYGNLASGTGSEIRARLIAEGLKKNKIDVYVVASGIPANFENIGISSFLLCEKQIWEKTLLDAVKSFNPDIIYGITEGRTDVVVSVAKKTKLPFAFDLHGIGFIEILELGSGYGSRLKRSYDSIRWLANARKADVITVSNPTLTPIISWLNKNTEPIIGMTDISHFNPNGPAKQIGLDKSNLQVLYAGNFQKWQGIDLLLEAIKESIKQEYPIEFTLIGPVDKNTELIEKWKKELSKENVHFNNHVNYNEIADFYRGADVMVIPRRFMLSTYFAFPQKLIDYMASGRAIVATNLKPHCLALDKNQAGILCKSNPQDLITSIHKTIDSDLRKSISHNARDKAVNDFDHIKQSAKIAKIFDEVL